MSATSSETPFQDGQTVASSTNGGIVIQAVKDVAAAGALYFSSAANSGNKNDGTSGTWEGDYLDGGAATGPLAGAGNVHNFGAQTVRQHHRLQRQSRSICSGRIRSELPQTTTIFIVSTLRAQPSSRRPRKSRTEPGR